MDENLDTTVSGRVSSRMRRLAETAAELRNTTLSQFVAEALERAISEALSEASAELQCEKVSLVDGTPNLPRRANLKRRAQLTVLNRKKKVKKPATRLIPTSRLTSSNTS